MMNTIRESGRGGKIAIKKSTFICSIDKVSTPAGARKFLERVKKDIPRATHHAFAVRTGVPVNWEDSSDDGEPRGTAGSPIMAILRGRKITNVIVVVSRHYGGTKLGTGGLARAYSQAASNLINAIGLEKVDETGEARGKGRNGVKGRKGRELGTGRRRVNAHD
ncbi:MAG: YigZ family protein [Promethearchaeota archaeon]